MILLFIAFVAGVLTVFAPCTLALLPVIVGGTMSGGTSKARAALVAVSLGVSVFIFTFVLKVSTIFLGVPETVWQALSGGIIMLLGVAMLFPKLWDRLPIVNSINRASNQSLATGFQKQSLYGDIIIGASLGPVFSSCSPTYFLILADVLPKSLGGGIVDLLAYVVGLCGTLLIVSFAGQKLAERFGMAADPNGIFKRVIGAVFVILGLVILLGYEPALELTVANHLYDVTTIERSLLSNETPAPGGRVADTQVAATSTQSEAERIATKRAKYQQAPEITDPSGGYINTDGKPITIGEFRGKKVVLIDFWTYSCINCQRTIPYLKAWYDKYHDQGLEIISIHTPEFAFEHVLANVQNAVDNTFGIKYPVVLDNNYGTWNAFGNQFWPRKYLVDIDGFIVYDHAGEGNYDETERAIQQALAERATILGTNAAVSSGTVTPSGVAHTDNIGSPEVYFGSARNEFLDNGTAFGTQTLKIPATVSLNKLYLGGTWTFGAEYASASAGSSIVFRYIARDVYLVASSESGATLSIFVDGKRVDANAGEDAPGGYAQIKEHRLYTLVHGAQSGEHTIEIHIDQGVLDAYTFTFG